MQRQVTLKNVTGMAPSIPVWYGGDHTGMVRAIPVQQWYWYGPANTSFRLKMYVKAGNLKKCAQNLNYWYGGDYNSMVRAIPVQQCNWYGPQHTSMAQPIHLSG